MMLALGKLEKVDVRKQWPGEASDFTPWLAKEENLSSLGEQIGFELELVERESGVGRYRADILARRTDTEERVVIENQFGKTDHNHLGQLLTYAAGVGTDGSGAKTIIWIAEGFEEPHRAALDWLNKCTEPGIRFFGVELELWSIGDSPFAPRFNVVSKPNDWQKRLTQETGIPSVTGQLYLDFWNEFIDYCEARRTTLRFPKPWARHWLPITIGRSSFIVSLTASKQKMRLGCELYMSGPDAKKAFRQLSLEDGSICQQLSAHPDFLELPDKEGSKIVEYLNGDISVRETWPELYRWLKERGEKYVAIFSPLVRQLKLD